MSVIILHTLIQSGCRNPRILSLISKCLDPNLQQMWLQLKCCRRWEDGSEGACFYRSCLGVKSSWGAQGCAGTPEQGKPSLRRHLLP